MNTREETLVNMLVDALERRDAAEEHDAYVKAIAGAITGTVDVGAVLAAVGAARGLTSDQIAKELDALDRQFAAEEDAVSVGDGDPKIDDDLI